MKKKLTLITLLLLSFCAFSQNVSYTFVNARNTNDGVNDFYEADIYVVSDTDFSLGSGQIYYNYNTAAFGENVKANSNFEMIQAPGSILATTFFGGAVPGYDPLVVNDNIDSRVSTAWLQAASSGALGNNITSTPKHLYSIKFKYINVNEPPGVSFETGSVFIGQTFTACGPTTSGFAPDDCFNEPGAEVTSETFDSLGAIIPSISNWTGTTSTDWHTASNWDTGLIPSETDDIIIPSGLTNYPTISSNVTVKSITINSGASLIANANVTGTTTFERNLPTNNWYLVASPVIGETIEDIIANHNLDTGTGSNIGLAPYTNNGSNAWEYQTQTSTGSLNLGEGYSIKLNTAATVSFTGTLNSADVDFGIATGTRNNFNLIGNPFTSYINSVAFTSASSNSALLTEETIWLWNGTEYVTFNEVNPIEIAPGQGFFVEASGNGTINFATANQSHQTTETFMRKAPIPSFELFTESTTAKKSTKVFYVNGKTTGFDNGYDSSIFGGEVQKFEIYTQLIANNKDKRLAIQTLPNDNYETMVVPVGLIAEAGKEITFSVKANNLPNGIEIYLEDKTNNTFNNLSEKNYTITTQNAINGTGQYYIHTSSQRLSNEDITKSNINVAIYKSSARKITIIGLQTKANMKVYSALGKEVMSANISSNGESTVNLPQLASGIYIVKLHSKLGNITKKIILE